MLQPRRHHRACGASSPYCSPARCSPPSRVGGRARRRRSASRWTRRRRRSRHSSTLATSSAGRIVSCTATATRPVLNTAALAINSGLAAHDPVSLTTCAFSPAGDGITDAIEALFAHPDVDADRRLYSLLVFREYPEPSHIPPRAGETPAGSTDASGAGSTDPTPRYATPAPTDTPRPSPAPDAAGHPSSQTRAWGQPSASGPSAAGPSTVGPSGPSGPSSPSGPSHPAGATGEQSWWQHRPSGAWSNQPWAGSAGAQGTTTAGATTGRYTQTLPRSGQESGYPSATPVTRPPVSGPGPADQARPRGRRTCLVVARPPRWR